MSLHLTATGRRRRFWLASSFLMPIMSLSISEAQARQAQAEPLPPIEVTSPTDPNRTRAKPTYDEASTSRRVVPAAAPSTGTRPAPGTGSNVASQSVSQGSGGSGGQQFSGIVGTASSVITADDIAHSPAQTLQEIIAQTPGVQLTGLFGGVNGAKTSVDLRGFGAFATSTLLTKNSFLDEIRRQYVLTARMKGLSERGVLYGHVFRNAMLIVVAGFPGAFIGSFFAGSLLIETIFSLDGLGLLSFESIVNRDYPVVFANLYIFSLIGLVVNLISDLTYVWIDPRIDFETREA